MKTFIQLFLISFLFVSCESHDKIEGVWYAAYELNREIKEELSDTYLLEFKNNQVFIVTIRDNSTGDLSKVNIDTFNYSIKKDQLLFDNFSSNIRRLNDSLILNANKRNIVFKRLPSKLKNVNADKSHFLGSFNNDNFKENNLSFINDSTLIYTGMSWQNNPVKKWEIINYSGYSFLNIHNFFEPVSLISFCSTDSINLVLYSTKIHSTALTRKYNKIEKSQLIGNWIEIENTYEKPPLPPPNFEKNGYKYKLSISSDSFNIDGYQTFKHQNWDLTPDGNRIYFIDDIFDEYGSIQLVNLQDDYLTLRFVNKSGFKEDIVKFEKIQ